MEPAIHNLIFVKSYYERIRWMKMYNKVCTSIQFISRGFSSPRETVIPLAQMTQLINACRKVEGNERALYLRSDEIVQYKGKQVKFVKGTFEDIESFIQRVNKNRMVVVTLKDVYPLLCPSRAATSWRLYSHFFVASITTIPENSCLIRSAISDGLSVLFV